MFPGGLPVRNLPSDWTLLEMVTTYPELQDALSSRDLNFWSRPEQTLEQACEQTSQRADEIRSLLCSEMGRTLEESYPHEGNLEDWSVHILKVHHDWLYRNFPALERLIEDLSAQHGDTWLLESQKLFTELREDLEFHMAKEERILFPLIRFMEMTRRLPRELSSCPGSVFGPIAVMEADHEATEAILQKLHDLVRAWLSDEQAQNKHIPRKLQELVLNIRSHIHKENNILFPRARALELELEKEVEGSS